ncbi:MAG: response regulator [Alphaproteobacteria bacterium]|nr:response regulator [Alphaproteobacteria bacterium]
MQQQDHLAGNENIRTPRCRVLLVEDEEDDRIFSKTTLENSGYVKEVTCFADGEELVKYMREQGFEDHSVNCAIPTIIIIDINLPRMDGLTLLARLKSDQFLEDIPVVILSGELNYESIRRALDLRADGVLRKPLNVEKVCEYLKHGWQSPGGGF